MCRRADSVAVISAILGAPSPEEATRQFIAKIGNLKLRNIRSLYDFLRGGTGVEREVSPGHRRTTPHSRLSPVNSRDVPHLRTLCVNRTDQIKEVHLEITGRTMGDLTGNLGDIAEQVRLGPGRQGRITGEGAAFKPRRHPLLLDGHPRHAPARVSIPPPASSRRRGGCSTRPKRR